MKKTAITAIGWLVTAALVWVMFTRIDMGSLWAGIARAEWRYLGAAAVVNIAVILLKSLRWQLMMRPRKRARYSGIFKATMIGLAANNVLPVRGGDWLKIYLLGKWEGASRAMLASITGLDKLFEGLAILILFGLLSLHSTFPEWVLKGTVIVSIVTAASLLICILLMFHHRRASREEADVAGRLSRLAAGLGSGMLMLGSSRLILATLGLSIAICLLQIETIRLCQLAFGLHMALWVPALVFVAINLAIIIPSAPSGIGPFEAAAVLAYSWFGISSALGLGVALCYHAVQFIPVTVAGAIMYMIEIGPGNRREVQKLRSREAKIEAGGI
ncbi:MAG: flippase-like domain-containing protein [Proteobacteria bacterium]|nr:flippase-like domain-containing protein [Pseudomonadota bacterium]